MRKLLVLAVVVAVLAAGDMWVRSIAEERVGAQIDESLASGGDARVEFSGFPFTVRLLAGSIPSATLASPSIERDGVRFTDVRMTMQDVTFSWSKALAGDTGSVEVRDGRGRASIPTPDLVRAFTAVAGDIEIDVAGGRIRVRVGPVEASARLTLDANELVLRAPGMGTGLRVGLPQLIDGLRYRSIRLAGGEVVVEFSLENASFRKL